GLAESVLYSRIRPIIFDAQAPGPEQAASLPHAELVARLLRAINLLRAYLKEEGKGDSKAIELESKLQRALLIAAKISFSITPVADKTAQGLDLNAKATIINGGSIPIQVSDLRLSLPDYWAYKENSKFAGGIDPVKEAT